ncbi:hypothetical protein B0H17DRAFT_1186917 [Mycena rosella]|uniref:Uncharacterized protein n=1 Tax=Mycena rosella TaxID=1033263 RepID=A0AAD7FY53_MYCRO|nr:hypothetical protein B0H17DRAFT_1186917 [Mycena rosella]
MDSAAPKPTGAHGGKRARSGHKKKIPTLGNPPQNPGNSERRRSAHPVQTSSISPAEFDQLAHQLKFIDKNDEYADVASGDKVINDSLVDTILEASGTNPTTEPVESSSSEANMDGPYATAEAIFTNVHPTQYSHFIAVQGVKIDLIRAHFTLATFLYGFRHCFLAHLNSSNVIAESHSQKTVIFSYSLHTITRWEAGQTGKWGTRVIATHLCGCDQWDSLRSPNFLNSDPVATTNKGKSSVNSASIRTVKGSFDTFNVGLSSDHLERLSIGI